VGRAGLPGPLCNEATAPDGTIYLIGWGRANHAGKGARNVLDALIADKTAPQPGADSVDGNALLYGNEVIHPGNTAPYPREQIEAAVRATAAKIELHGWKATSVIQHKGWTRRKVDMSWHGAAAQLHFQAEVDRALREGPARYRFPRPAQPSPGTITPPVDTTQQQGLRRVMVLYRTPTDGAAYELMGAQVEQQHLRWVRKAEADALRASGTHLLILIVDGVDPLWRLPKVG
jgi:hypothetical protein